MILLNEIYSLVFNERIERISFALPHLESKFWMTVILTLWVLHTCRIIQYHVTKFSKFYRLNSRYNIENDQ